MKKICPIPIEPGMSEQLQKREALRQEILDACSIPYAFLVGVPSKTPTATALNMMLRSRNLELRNKLIDNARLVNR